MRRSWLLAAVLGALVLVTVLVAGPNPGAARSPQGTLALRRFLSSMGLQVRDGGTPPATGVFVLLTDLRDTRQVGGLMGWVQDGGTLVVTDPASPILDAAGIVSTGRVGHYDFGPARLQPGCVTAETAGVATLAVDAGDRVLAGTGAGSISCFPSGPDGASFEVSKPVGTGRVVVLGGVSPLTNALLGKQDNAAFAIGLFGSVQGPSAAAPGPVVFGPPADPGEAPIKGLWSSLPPAARAALVQIALGALAFALMRARRLGRPLAEQLPSAVPAVELVDAVGRLYRSSRTSGFAGIALRRATLQRMRARLGLSPAGTTTGAGAGGDGAGDDEALSSTLAALAGRQPEDVRRLLFGPAPVDDAALIALGRDLEEFRRQVDRSWA